MQRCSSGGGRFRKKIVGYVGSSQVPGPFHNLILRVLYMFEDVNLIEMLTATLPSAPRWASPCEMPCTVHARRFVPTFKPRTRPTLARSTLKDILGSIGGQMSEKRVSTRFASQAANLHSPAGTSISLTEPTSGRGRSLVAEREVRAGEVLMSLPLKAMLHVYDGPDTLPWGMAMALQILRKRSRYEVHTTFACVRG